MPPPPDPLPRRGGGASFRKRRAKAEKPPQSQRLAPLPLGEGQGEGYRGEGSAAAEFCSARLSQRKPPDGGATGLSGPKKTSVSAGFQRSPPPHRSADRRPDIPNGKRLPGCETRPAGQGSRRLVPPDRGGKGIDIREVWGRPGTAARAVRALMETDIGDKNLYVKEKSEIIGIMFGICPNAPFDFAQGRLLRLRSGQAPSIRPALRYAACGGYSG